MGGGGGGLAIQGGHRHDLNGMADGDDLNGSISDWLRNERKPEITTCVYKGVGEDEVGSQEFAVILRMKVCVCVCVWGGGACMLCVCVCVKGAEGERGIRFAIGYLLQISCGQVTCLICIFPLHSLRFSQRVTCWRYTLSVLKLVAPSAEIRARIVARGNKDTSSPSNESTITR